MVLSYSGMFLCMPTWGGEGVMLVNKQVTLFLPYIFWPVWPDRSMPLALLTSKKLKFGFGLIFLFSSGFLSVELEEGALCGSVLHARKKKLAQKECKGEFIISASALLCFSQVQHLLPSFANWDKQQQWLKRYYRLRLKQTGSGTSSPPLSSSQLLSLSERGRWVPVCLLMHTWQLLLACSCTKVAKGKWDKSSASQITYKASAGCELCATTAQVTKEPSFSQIVTFSPCLAVFSSLLALPWSPYMKPRIHWPSLQCL